jgi:hypothetical protein
MELILFVDSQAIGIGGIPASTLLFPGSVQGKVVERYPGQIHLIGIVWWVHIVELSQTLRCSEYSASANASSV